MRNKMTSSEIISAMGLCLLNVVATSITLRHLTRRLPGGRVYLLDRPLVNRYLHCVSARLLASVRRKGRNM